MTDKKPKGGSDKEQSERFEKTVRDMVAAGVLNPIEADVALDRLVSERARKTRSI